jgi:hypothetical protein
MNPGSPTLTPESVFVTLEALPDTKPAKPAARQRPQSAAAKPPMQQ